MIRLLLITLFGLALSLQFCLQLTAQTLVADTLLLQNWEGTGFIRQAPGTPVMVLTPGTDSLYGFRQYNNRSDSYQNVWEFGGNSGVNAAFKDQFRKANGTDTLMGAQFANNTPGGEHGAHIITAQSANLNYTANGYHRQGSGGGATATSSVGFYSPAISTDGYQQVQVVFFTKSMGQIDADFGALRYSTNPTAPSAPLPDGSAGSQPDNYWTYAIPNNGDLVGGNATPAPGLEYQISNHNRFTEARYTLPTDAADATDLRICFWWQNNSDGIGSFPGFTVDDIVVIGLREDTSFKTTALAKDTFCVTENLDVPFTIAPDVITQPTDLFVLLSDINGSFANADTIGFGSYTPGTALGSVDAQIPMNTADGTGYRVTIVATTGDTADVSPTTLTVSNQAPPVIADTDTLNPDRCDGLGQLGLVSPDGVYTSFQWRLNGAGIPDATAADFAAVNAGVYTLLAGNAVCTVESNSLNFGGESLPSVNIISTDPVRLCYEDTIVIDTSAVDSSGFWGITNSGFETVQFFIGTTPVTRLTGSDLGEGLTQVTLIYSETICNTADTVIRNVFVPTDPNPIVRTSEGVTGVYPCFDGAVALSVAPPGDGTVLWSNGAVRDFNSPTVSVDTLGQYSAQITQDGCLYTSDTITVSTSSDPPAPVIAALNGSVLSGTADYFTGARIGIYEGSQGNFIGETTVSNNAWSFTVPGSIPTEYIFWARLLVDSNCDGEINANDTPGPFSAALSAEFLPPTLITPDGDGKNDVFVFGGSPEDLTGQDFLLAYPNLSLTVFSRWGLEVFSAQPYQNNWDGDDAPAGTYYYILDFGDDSRSEHKGYVTIRR